MSELQKQFTTYADAITAFATAQAVAFALLISKGDCFTQNVIVGRRYSIVGAVIVNLAYLVLVFLCKRAVDNSGPSGVTNALLGNVWILRYAIIAIDLLASVFVILGIYHGWTGGDPKFLIDCDGSTLK